MSKSGPFARHLIESIEINSKRLPRYAKLTGFRSVPHSLKLIFSEQASLPFALLIDGLSSTYRKSGVPIGDLEFISMTLVPEFRERFPFDPEPLSTFVPYDGKALSRSLIGVFRREGFEGVSRVASGEFAKLQAPRAYHAMTRHLLESVIRLANLAPLHETRAKELGVKGAASCGKISRMLFWGHVASFGAGAAMDRAAAPIQAKGIPIIWQDVPEIPPTSDFYRKPANGSAGKPAHAD